ncbi:hypothetical protein C6P41_003231 [Kluyveromyces marxianus]|nr:hypothetical protein C6P43_001121 [Kluyveromyces marxianus]KAG0683319.1 hypothetical protein C6P41_003231 [Kluyveromyces marxianus]
MLPTRVELMISTLLVWRLTNLAIEAVLVVELAPSSSRWVVSRHVWVCLPVLFFILSSSSPVKALSYSKEMNSEKRRRWTEEMRIGTGTEEETVDQNFLEPSSADSKQALRLTLVLFPVPCAYVYVLGNWEARSCSPRESIVPYLYPCVS